jgi:thiol-disulfide isomerase/thioredoxin
MDLARIHGEGRMTVDRRPPTPEPQPPVESDRSDYVAGVDERPQRRREWAGGLRSVVLPLLAVTAIVAAVWYLQSGRGGGAEQEAGVGIVALPAENNPTGRPAAAEEGRAAPDFVLRTLDGGTVRLSDLRGSVVLLNFWATWCPPCREEVPELVRAYAAEQGRGFTVVAVDLQEPEGPVREFAQQFRLRPHRRGGPHLRRGQAPHFNLDRPRGHRPRHQDRSHDRRRAARATGGAAVGVGG